MAAIPESTENALSSPCEKALHAILMSIAAEENALSRLIEVESEKINYVIERMKKENIIDIQKLVDVNKSVTALLERINDVQKILKEKMTIALEHLPCDTDTTPPKPVDPCGPSGGDDPCSDQDDPCPPPRTINLMPYGDCD